MRALGLTQTLRGTTDRAARAPLPPACGTAVALARAQGRPEDTE